jgi:hypothetical protein
MKLLDIFQDRISRDFVQDLLRRYQTAKMNRSPWEGKWNEILRLVFPGPEALQSGSVGAPPGSVTTHCSEVVAKINRIISTLCSMLVAPSHNWLTLKYRDISLTARLDSSTASNKWLKAVAGYMLNLMASPQSNFYCALYSIIYQWFTLGVAYGVLDLHENGSFSLDCVRTNDCAIGVSGYNEVTEVFRTLNLTASQAMDLYGTSISDVLLQEARDHSSTRHEFVEFNIRNPFQDQMLEVKVPAMPYVSLVVEMTEQKIVDFRQYPKLPYVTPRFNLEPSELYGRSYVWDAMPTIKIINKIHKIFVKGCDFGVSPMIATKPGMAKLVNRIAPGAILPWLDSSGQPLAMQFPYGAEPKNIIEYLQYLLSTLDEILGARDLFTEDIPSKTAHEVELKAQQISARLMPMVVRFETECLSPLVELFLLLLAERKALPLFPYKEVAREMNMDELELMKLLPAPLTVLNAEFHGRTERMRMQEDFANCEKVLQFAVQLGQVNPNALHRINLGEVMKKAALVNLNDEAVINDDSTVEKKDDAARNQVNLQDEKTRAEIEYLTAQTQKLRAETNSIMQGVA